MGEHPFRFLHSYVWCTSGLSSSTITEVYGTALADKPTVAVFLDELSDTCNLDRNRFIVVYADDNLLISTSPFASGN